MMNAKRPQPFSKYTAAELWCDEHISAQMLACHLNPDIDPASRNHAFIQRSAAWIIEHFNLGQGKNVADFGCGPGLYATLFAKTGASVTGIDFSPRSIAYAKEQAAQAGEDIDYVEQNYLNFSSTKRFDLITLIYTDLCVLSPAQRRQLLTIFAAHLAEGGKILLDVAAHAAFNKREEASVTEANFMGGFWSPEDYTGRMDTYLYPEQKLALDKFTIVEEDRTREVYNWMQYFDAATITGELEACGLKVITVYGNVAGEPLTSDSDTIAVVAELA
jgi:SAM-dependent methyltransferase